MFQFLHRVMKLSVVALWLSMAFLVWQQRERGRPLVDLYEAWRDAGYQEPQPLPRLEGTVLRVLGENTIQLKATNGITYNLTMAGTADLGPVGTPEPGRRQFAAETSSNLSTRLVGQPVEFAYTLLQANHTGVGFAYVGTNRLSVTLALVAEGRGKLMPQALRVLPLREQLALRAADRAAQAERQGLCGQGWVSDNAAGR